MSNILLNMIHANAKKTMNVENVITADNYHIWVKHWFDTAEELVNEFEAMGLPETAKAIRNIIAAEKLYLGGRYENESSSSAPSTR